MVKVCDSNYPEASDAECAEHFGVFSFPLSPFQKYAIEAIVNGHHVLVCAPTGSGKTLPSEFAIQHFVSAGKKVIYCSPIKALSNQKYYEFTNKYPHITFGIQTGDIKSNPNADVIIMTTEILMNALFTGQSNAPTEKENNPLQFQIDIQNELACVVFDEVHYINDESRGQTWEKTILMLPPHVQMVMLSATIDNPTGFAQWCEDRYVGEGAKEVWLAYTNHRIVPLSHYGFITVTEGLFKSVKNKETEKQVRESTNKLIPLQDHKGIFNETGYRTILKNLDLLNQHQVCIHRKHTLNQLALHLRDREMLPAIAFVFSRKHVELCAQEITIPLLEDDSKVGYNVRRECEAIVRKLPNHKEYIELPEFHQLMKLLEKGIGIHHSGMIPVLREIVELMISKKYIKMLFATESFAIGLDCPIKTAVFTSLTKFDGRTERHLYAHEYTQMAGRAGRRGIDTVGHVVHCNNLFTPPPLADYKSILSGIPQKLVSKYHVNYGLLLNLFKNNPNQPLTMDQLSQFSTKSMVSREIQDSIHAQAKEKEALEERLCKKRDALSLLKTPEDACKRYMECETLIKVTVNKKRKELEREIRILQDTYRAIKQDAGVYKELVDMEIDRRNQEDTLAYMGEFVCDQTKKCCDILAADGFIERADYYSAECIGVHTKDFVERNIEEFMEQPTTEFVESKLQKQFPTGYVLTSRGQMASHIAEIHPLVLTRYFEDWRTFTPKQMVGLFSCFTDVKVPQDQRQTNRSIEDPLVRAFTEKVDCAYGEYDKLEGQLDLRTAINYVDALIYDMVNIAMQWTELQTEQECREFIQASVSSREISIGDFNKALLKIVTITKEWEKVCETMGYVDTLYTLSQIDHLLMKYVTTSQSLYI
jgi:superfamily II RNA helicase